MHEVYSMLKQKGLRLILINDDHADGITLDHVKTLLEGTKAVAQIKALEEKSIATPEELLAHAVRDAFLIFAWSIPQLRDPEKYAADFMKVYEGKLKNIRQEKIEGHL